MVISLRKRYGLHGYSDVSINRLCKELFRIRVFCTRHSVKLGNVTIIKTSKLCKGRR